MRRLKARDEEAVVQFYDRFATILFSTVDAILNDQKESQAVLEGSFLQIWKSARSYDETRSSLFTSAVMFSRHNAIERVRSQQRQKPVAPETKETISPRNQSSAALTWQHERERIRAALDQLDRDSRDAIELAFFSGLTEAEIAERLGAESETVKSRLRSGLFGLRDLLAGRSS